MSLPAFLLPTVVKMMSQWEAYRGISTGDTVDCFFSTGSLSSSFFNLTQSYPSFTTEIRCLPLSFSVSPYDLEN